MISENNAHKNMRFFASSSILEKQKNAVKQHEDPNPFGLNLQEPFPETIQSPKSGVSVGACVTMTPKHPDVNVDVD